MPMPHSSSSSSSVLPGRLADVGSGLFGQTLGRAVDRLAGEDTRKRLESGVDQLSTFPFPPPSRASPFPTPASPPWMWRS